MTSMHAPVARATERTNEKRKGKGQAMQQHVLSRLKRTWYE